MKEIREWTLSILPNARCNQHILGLGQRIKKSLVNAGIIGYQYGVVGVSDGISMGTSGSKFVLY
jgi:dihydroxy-acid dehydratase